MWVFMGGGGGGEPAQPYQTSRTATAEKPGNHTRTPRARAPFQWRQLCPYLFYPMVYPMVAQNPPNLPRLENMHLVCQHVGKTLIKVWKIYLQRGSSAETYFVKLSVLYQRQLKHKPNAGKLSMDHELQIFGDQDERCFEHTHQLSHVFNW